MLDTPAAPGLSPRYAGLATDAFFVAFKIPNFLRRLFAEGAFSQAFVPILSEYKTRRGEDELHGLFAQHGLRVVWHQDVYPSGSQPIYRTFLLEKL